MNAAPKQIAVIIATGDGARTSEALRAAVGLTLRGARVQVVIPAASTTPRRDPAIDRSAALLAALGHEVTGEDTLGEAVARADAVQVWT